MRSIEFQREDDASQRHTTSNVVVRTAPVAGRPVTDEPSGTGADEAAVSGNAVRELVWLDRAPEERSEGVAADIRSVLR